MPSPYSLGAQTDLSSLPPEMQAVAAKGMQALKTGQITPDQALANYKKAGISPYGPTAPGNGIGPETQAQAKFEATPAATAVANQGQVNAQFPEQPSLPSVDKGSGLTNRDMSLNKLLDTTKDARPQGISQEEFQNLYGMVTGTPAYKKQQTGLDETENALKMEQAKETPLDYRPILSTIDHWTGSKLAENYAVPESAQARSKRLFDAMQKVQGDRKDLETNTTSGVKGVLGGTLSSGTSVLDQIQQMRQAQDPNSAKGGVGNMDRNVRALVGGVQKDMAEIKQSNAATQEAQRMLAGNSSVLDTTFRDKFLKAMIGGRVTNYDLMRQSGDQALADKAEQIWTTMADGTFSPRNAAEYRDALRIISEANQHEAAARMGYWRNVGTTAFQIDPERVGPVVDLGAMGIGSAPASVLEKSGAKTQKAIANPATRAGAQPDMIRVKSPDGKVYKMPSANRKKAEALGYKVVQ